MVFIYHAYLGAAQAGDYPAFLQGDFEHFIATLRIGLEIFFIISGYLITETLIRKGNVTDFLVDRALRVYPAYLGVLIPLCVLGMALRVDMFAETPAWSWPLHVLSNLLFVPGVFDAPIVLKVAWSLSFEAAFYLATAWAFVLYQRGRPATVVAFSLAIGFLLFSRSATAMFFFAGIGICLFREQLVNPFMRRVPPSLIFVLLVIVWQTLVLQYARPHAPLTGTFALMMVAAFYLGLHFFDAVVDGRGPMVRALAWRPIQFTATVSYSFYLWHTVIMWPLKRTLIPQLLPSLGPELTLLVFSLTSLIITYLVAWLSYEMLEYRLRNFLVRKLRAHRQARQQGQTA